LGLGAHYQGDLDFEGRIRIDGYFTCSVRSPDLLEVGAAGTVQGRIEVAQALIGGRVEGELHASERVTLLETATVIGRIVTPWLDVRTGAQLQATVAVSHEE
jgi:cytoskeletal protein CcmA (bactofilin family)